MEMIQKYLEGFKAGFEEGYARGLEEAEPDNTEAVMVIEAKVRPGDEVIYDEDVVAILLDIDEDYIYVYNEMLVIDRLPKDYPVFITGFHYDSFDDLCIEMQARLQGYFE